VRKTAFAEAYNSTASFCFMECSGQMQLSKPHAFYYQIQTQMHVTHLPWCDFVVWSPAQEPFIEHVKYNAGFMTTALRRNRNLYFSKFLPSVLSIILVSE